MPRSTPNSRKRNNSSPKSEDKKQDSKCDTPSQSDSCSGTDTDSACYSLESSDTLASSSSSKPILLQPTLDYKEGSSKSRGTNPFKTDSKAEASSQATTDLKEASKAEASSQAVTDPKTDSKAEASTQAATDPKTDSNAEPGTKEATKATTDPKTDSNGEASMKTTAEDTTTPKRNSKSGATTQAIIVPMAVSKIEAASQATAVPEAGNETKVATQAATQAATTPKTDSETEDIAEHNTISNAFSKIEADLQAETFRAPRHRNTWARPRQRLKGFAELEKEKEEAAKESTSQVLPVKAQDNDSTNDDKEVTPTESQDNGAIDEDKKTALFQSNDASNEDEKAAPVESQDNGAVDEDKEAAPTEPQANDSTNEDKKTIPYQGNDATDRANNPLPAIPQDKEENVTPQSENHVSSALTPESALPRTSQSSESSYYTALTTSEWSYHTARNTGETSYHTAVTDGNNEASTSARAATPDLISSFPIIPPRSSSIGNLIITDASHNPIGAPRQASSSSLKVLHSNHTSTTEDSLASGELQENMSTTFDQTNTAEGDTNHINAPPLRRQGAPEDTSDSETEEEFTRKYLPDIPALDSIQVYHPPDILEIVRGSPQDVSTYNSLMKVRLELLADKEKFQNDLYEYRDLIARVRRGFIATRNKLDDLDKERKSHMETAPFYWTRKEAFFRDKMYLYGKRSLNIALNAIKIGDNIDAINATVIQINEEAHVLQYNFRNNGRREKKVGCISCFKKIGRLFKSKKSKN